MKKIYCLLAAAILAVGCTEDVTTDNAVVNNQANYEMIEVVADLEIDEESRTTLTDGGQGGKVVWSANDAIGAVLEDDSIVECVATSVNGSSATFSVPSTTKYAIYPYSSKTTYTDGVLSHTLVNTVTLDGSAKVFGDGQNVMVAHLSEGTLPFKHLCGFIEVKLKGTGTVKHVALRSNSQNWDVMSGLGNIDLSDAANPVFTAKVDHSVAFNWIYATCNNVELSKSGAKSFYFVVPPRTYKDLCICVQTEEGSYTISSKNSIVVNRAKIRPIAAIDIDTVKPVSATDLSVNGVANCYIVPQGGDAKYYSFPARKINGNANLEGIAYAHLSWSESATLVTNVSYDAETGTVSFKYEGNNAEGNAHIVLLNNKHEIVWHNHIWCTDQPQKTVVANGNTQHAILDRNLGATYAPKTVAEATSISEQDASDALGLYYQYGRPSPFPRANTITGGNESSAFKNNTRTAVQYAFAKYNQIMATSKAVYSYDNALKYPKMFYYIGYSEANGSEETHDEAGSNATWYGKTVYHPFNDSEKLWHTEAGDVVSKKSDNDPCPAGYVVDDNESATKYTLKRFTLVSNQGFYYQCPITEQFVWFPLQGYRGYNNGLIQSLSSNFNLWAGFASAPANNLNCVRFYGSSTTAINNTYTQQSYGFGVRCRAMDRSDLNQDAIKTFDGDGTEASPYLIKTTNDLMKLSGLCNGLLGANDNVDYTTAHYALAANIDMKNVKFSPITPFSGSFDGKTYTISNLTVTHVSDQPNGLFGTIENATIKNVTLDNYTLNVTSNTLHTGGIAGKATDSTISNCNVNGSVTSTCSASFESVSGTNGASAVVGGVVGWTINTKIEKCNISGAVQSTTGQFVGGIVGHAEGGKIDNCKILNGSDIYCKMNHMGGIVARMTNDTEVTNCVVDTPIICGATVCGGIVGRMQSGIVSNCLVTSNSEIIAHQGSTSVGSAAGGIVGYLYTAAGLATKATVENCACYTDVTANSFIGGIVGEAVAMVEGVDVKIQNNFYTGALTVRSVNGSWAVAGGIVGCVGNNTNSKGTINVSNSVGLVKSITFNVQATYPGGGGVVGYIKLATFDNCYSNLADTNISMVSGSGNQYGSLYGVAWWGNGAMVKNSYYLKDNRIGRDGGTAAPVNVAGLTIAEMTNGTLLNKLKAVGGTWTTNAEGYPVPAGAPADTGAAAAPQQ